MNIDDIATIRAAISAAAASGAGGGTGDAGASDAGAGDAGAGDAGSGGFGLGDGGVTQPMSCDGDPNAQQSEGFPASCDSMTPPAGKATFRVDLPAGVHPPGSPYQPPPDILANPPIVHMALYLERSCHNQNITLYALDGWITFSALFDGDPNETSADQKLTERDLQHRDRRPEGRTVRRLRGRRARRVALPLCGNFRFYFERGQPAQPFP